MYHPLTPLIHIANSVRVPSAEGVLSFDARSQNTTWRRISYCLNDLRYLLSVRPPQWTDQLRKGFLHGFTALLDVLGVMEVSEDVGWTGMTEGHGGKGTGRG